MSKVTLDRDTFKALASDTRLDILRTLDGRKMNLTEIASQTKLNKATLHEHLSKLAEAGLVKKKEREGHKWVYYKLSWKGENILHPENTRIVIMFSMTFVALAAGFIQLYLYLKGTVFAFSDELLANEKGPLMGGNETGVTYAGVC
jgi:DNA-binding transcriptional ArsR family regulator